MYPEWIVAAGSVAFPANPYPCTVRHTVGAEQGEDGGAAHTGGATLDILH
jgi:hypothetical protein